MDKELKKQAENEAAMIIGMTLAPKIIEKYLKDYKNFMEVLPFIQEINKNNEEKIVGFEGELDEFDEIFENFKETLAKLLILYYQKGKDE